MNKLNDKIRKKALIGVVFLGIAAIVTVGLLSINNKDGEDTPDPLVDLNSQIDNPNLTSDDDGNPGSLAKITPALLDPGVDVTDNQTGDSTSDTEPGTQTEPQVSDTPVQSADTDPDDQPGETEPSDTQVADGDTPDEGVTVADGNTTPDKEEETDTTAVLSPQVIAESLSFSRETGLLWPIQGQVIIPYSPTHGVFHFTLEQFRTSDAIVLSAEVGTPVYAAAKGVVISITNEVRTGNTVKLALGNETYLVYGQLALEGLKEGDIVEEGQCIGKIAEPTRYYVIEGGNLFFQVLEGEESVNPMLLLREETTE